MEDNPIGFISTTIQYYLGINPDELTDYQWAEKYKQIAEIRRLEKESGLGL